jgi:Fe-Mn family superoxide dismutase
MADYTLPDLPYDYAALEPHISGRIMELHHDKHHATYVAGANTTLEKLAAARESGDLGAVAGLEKTLAFNLGGHVNHSVFWQNLSPDGEKLVIVQLYDQQGNIPLGIVPIVVLDMWEHAFYLDYVNVKADYVKAWWNIVNWADAGERFTRARTQTAGLIVPSL